jgi:iron complex outermembrane recepter protein
MQTRPRLRSALLAFLLGSTGMVSTAFADAPPAPNEVVVTAPLARTREDVIAGISVIGGLDLARDRRSTIADSLLHVPGVSATSFGPSASRPVLRGQQGARIRVLTDGIGSFDVSATSVDHAVAINPLLAERVEVVRGPSALLFGSEAIGGVVNVIDTRIPRTIPAGGVRVAGEGTYGSAADERSGSASADIAAGKRLVFHVDGSYSKTGDLRIGGHALTRPLRTQALASDAAGFSDDEIDFAANAAIKDRLPNSAAETWNAAAAMSVVTDTGHLGLAYSHYDSLYGIPIRYATLPGEEQEAPRLDVKQDRIDARAEFAPGGDVIDQVRARIGAARYRHYELEEDGAIGTAFYSQGMEGRVELIQAQRGAWRGVTGGQFFYRDFNVVGEEAFLPRNSTDSAGIFTLQQLDFGGWKVEGGARFEHSLLKAQPGSEQDQFPSARRRFNTISGSVGASAVLGEGWRVGVNATHSERAPSAEELFANGPHAGTQTFEVGQTNLRKESAHGLEAVLHGHGDRYDIEASVYYNRFANYIDSFASGEEEDGLPVFETRQGKARYYGFEVSGSLTLAQLGDTTLLANGLADYVHATVIGAGPAPRIPPLRLLGGLEARGGRLFGLAEIEWTARQDRVTDFESETGGFATVNASIGIHPIADNRSFSLILSANNLFDVVARRHASYLKDYAPLAGRDIRVTARFAL